MAHPLPGETLLEFARRHFLGVREVRATNKWFAGQPRTEPAWESELELRKHTTDTTASPLINLALYPDDKTSTDAELSDDGARASQRRSARTSGRAISSSALLRVHRTMPMDRKSDHDLIPGIPAWQYGFDWEHYTTRIVEALLKTIQTEMIGGTVAESTSRIERFNRRIKEIKCSWKVELCAPNQVGDKATPKYKAVQLSGSEARKLLNEHVNWLDVLDTERGELYREVWGLFKSINAGQLWKLLAFRGASRRGIAGEVGGGVENGPVRCGASAHDQQPYCTPIHGLGRRKRHYRRPSSPSGHRTDMRPCSCQGRTCACAQQAPPADGHMALHA
eukprot:jgi/Mesvir1/29236/Mv11417-RA.1